MRPLSIAIAFGVTSLGMLVSSNNAQAATFNVPGVGVYDITTLQTSYSENSTLLSAQPWYGNAIEALTFASTVGSSFGTPNPASVSVGPLFPYASNGAYTYFPGSSLKATSVGYSPDTTYSFAVATAVPEPSELVGTLALGFIGLVFQFKRSSLNLNKVK
ncbi:MAG: hypothetical protein JOZ78_04040 [Chroococcidiopsidaceae cyanobacterium CP_BM_ER_R8_30]|nr:hypothetical protein [Chroococcidiopsidaceae cyanobacterium CP_BM_ER_R8_30]